MAYKHGNKLKGSYNLPPDLHARGVAAARELRIHFTKLLECALSKFLGDDVPDMVEKQQERLTKDLDSQIQQLKNLRKLQKENSKPLRKPSAAAK